MTFFNDEFEAKVCLADMLSEVTYGQAEVLTIACDKWDQFDKIKEVLGVETNEVYDEVVKLKNEIQMTRDYLHDHNLEWDLVSYSKSHQKCQ